MSFLSEGHTNMTTLNCRPLLYVQYTLSPLHMNLQAYELSQIQPLEHNEVLSSRGGEDFSPPQALTSPDGGEITFAHKSNTLCMNKTDLQTNS